MNNRTFFYPTFRRYMLITTSALDHMYAYTQRRLWHREAGGEIYAPDPNTHSIVITEATGPNPNDCRKRHSFNPNTESTTQDRHRLFTKGLHAVGLWHTHPEAQPFPSELDYKTTDDYLKAFNEGREFYLLVIIGNRGHPPAMTVCSVGHNYRARWLEIT